MELALVPQRTNQFQELVAMIERSLAPRGAKVTESAMVAGADDEEREIDVLIESEFGAYGIKVAVEAKDEKRPMEITRFESIIAKYSPVSGIKVDKVVVVSRSGFSDTVVRRAEREGIELLTLESAVAADWARLVPQIIHVRVPPHVEQLRFEPPIMRNDALGGRVLHYFRYQGSCRCNLLEGNSRLFELSCVVDSIGRGR